MYNGVCYVMRHISFSGLYMQGSCTAGSVCTQSAMPFLQLWRCSSGNAWRADVNFNEEILTSDFD